MNSMTVSGRGLCFAGPLLLVLVAGCSRESPSDYRTSAGSVHDITAPKPAFASSDSGYTNWCMEWSRETYLGAYERHGKQSSRWDDAVRSALSNYACIRVTRKAAPSMPQLRENLEKAVAAGCDDPLVGYLHLRLVQYDPNDATPKIAAEFARAARELDRSSYAGINRCFAHLRAAQAWRSASTNQLPQVNEHRGLAFDRLLYVLQQDDLPVTFAYEICDEMYSELVRSPQSCAVFRAKINPLITTRWPEEALVLLLKGRFAIDDAWAARGSGWANTVTDKGWRLFAQRLALAEEALDRSWELDSSLPGTPLQYLKLELGQGRGRERMELWFNRAIAHPQNRYDALQQKLWYLQPRWYGSEKECLKVARDILKSDEFTGNCPLQLYQLHESLAKFYERERPNYWLEPHVWPDIKASFDRYFALQESDNGWRHNYVLCAYRCRQWDVLNEELSKLGSVNHDYFGGEETFARIQSEARLHAKQ